jgi:ATP-dependent Clp protease adaptor protein ClpS
MSTDALIKNKTHTIHKKPPMFKVFLLNDDYSTMEFVIEVLVVIFKKELPEATAILLDVHHKGRGVVGLYVFDIACTKVREVELAAQAAEFPLKAGMEEDSTR